MSKVHLQHIGDSTQTLTARLIEDSPWDKTATKEPGP